MSSQLSEFYDLTGEVVDLSIHNTFTRTLDCVGSYMGENLRTFGFFLDEVQVKHGVTDVALAPGLFDKTVPLYVDVANHRRDMLRQQGIFVSDQSEHMNKMLFYDYLLTSCVCYVEVPKMVEKNGTLVKTYDKFLGTKNLRLFSQWIDEPVQTLQYKYIDKVQTSYYDLQSNLLRLGKLTSTKNGGKITIPRTPVEITELGMRCIPLIAINSFLRGIEKPLREGILEFTFLKDNDTERVLNSTLNYNIMMDYYKDAEYVSKAYDNIAFFNDEIGGMTLSTRMNRGYIQLPELGASRYDARGTRSVNLARILKIRKVDSVDRTFIDVDLNIVISEFEKQVNDIRYKNSALLKEVAFALLQNPEVRGMDDTEVLMELLSWVQNQDIILTTTFRRYLHKFMIQNSSVFPTYTGKPTYETPRTDGLNFGAETQAFDKNNIDF